MQCTHAIDFQQQSFYAGHQKRVLIKKQTKGILVWNYLWTWLMLKYYIQGETQTA